MNLELDHFFILTDKPKEAGDALLSMGLEESFSRDHEGQGTSNRRFQFSNSMLEILYVRDVKEAEAGPAKKMRFPERVKNAKASPFGIIVTRLDEADSSMPFPGWRYQPDYFDTPNAFHIGDNSDCLEEPLCVYVPFIGPVSRKEETGKFKRVSDVRIVVPVAEMSGTLCSLKVAKGLTIELGDEHLMAVTLDKGNCRLSQDFRPGLPLVVCW